MVSAPHHTNRAPIVRKASRRSAIALVLGFVAADTNIFSGLSTNQGLFVLFFIGLFPSWAMDALRQRAQAVFKPAGPACDTLPLCMIDGLDDGIADRLAETGIWDIVHIATSDPFDLAAKTLYPLRRILDWMDQVILISYIRGQIIHFRACGLLISGRSGSTIQIMAMWYTTTLTRLGPRTLGLEG